MPLFKQCWQFQTETPTDLSPTTFGEYVFIPLSDGVAALDVSDGGVLWRTTLGGATIVSPIVGKNSLFVVSQTKSVDENKIETVSTALRTLSLTTGLTLKQQELSFVAGISLAFSQNTLLAAIRQTDGKTKIIGFAADSGEIRWTRETSSPLSSQLFAANENIYFGTADNSLFSLKIADGTIKQKYELPHPAQNRLTIVGATIVFGDAAGRVTALRETDSRVMWTIRTGGAIQDIVETTRGVLIASLDNFVYLHSLSNGKRRWRKRLSARPISAGLITPDLILLLAAGEETASIAQLKKGKIVNQINLGTENFAVAASVSAGKNLIIPTLKGVVGFAQSDSDTCRAASEPPTEKGAK